MSNRKTRYVCNPINMEFKYQCHDWGCSNDKPLNGVELNPKDMRQMEEQAPFDHDELPERKLDEFKQFAGISWIALPSETRNRASLFFRVFQRNGAPKVLLQNAI